tara:strand:+ start:35437 stop:35619 length:183 start_codon:yes stop_codon:yes gene_type:complete
LEKGLAQIIAFLARFAMAENWVDDMFSGQSETAPISLEGSDAQKQTSAAQSRRYARQETK